MQRGSRRRFLRRGCAVGMVATAGCVFAPDGSSSDDGAEPGGGSSGERDGNASDDSDGGASDDPLSALRADTENLGTDAVVWRNDEGDAAGALRDGTLFGQSNAEYGEGCVLALDAGTGERRWGHDVSWGWTTCDEPIVTDGVYVTATTDARGGVVAVDVDGTRRWAARTEFPERPLLLHAGGVFVGTGSGDVLAFDAESGDELWTTELVKGLGSATVRGATNGSVVATTDDGRFVALDTDDGARRWTVDVGDEPRDVLGGGPAFFASAATVGRVEDGTVRWTADVGPESRVHGRLDDVLVVGGAEHVGGLDVGDGSERWRVDQSGERTVLVDHTRVHVAGTELRTVTAAGETSSEIAVGEPVRALASGDGVGVVAATEHGVLRAEPDENVRYTTAVEGAERVTVGSHAFVGTGDATLALDFS